VEQLYEAFVRAKKKAAGEEMGKMTHAGFNEFVRRKTEDLQKQKNCHEVEYVVETIDGQVKLKPSSNPDIPLQSLSHRSAFPKIRASA